MKGTNVRVDSKTRLLCKHCGKSIEHAKLIGFSLICPLCRKPQNGHPHMALENTRRMSAVLKSPIKTQKMVN